jgi:hypothetical protein
MHPRPGKRFARGALLVPLLFAPLAQDTSASVPSATDALDEVIVEGKRGQLDEMIQEMVVAEDKFFARYNELNANDDFDMHCFRAARTGTRLKSRFCTAVYMDKALQENGQDYALFLQRNFKTGGGTTYSQDTNPPTLLGGPPVSAMVTIEARREDFKQNMRDVVARNPELVEMLRKRDELGNAMRLRGARPGD